MIGALPPAGGFLPPVATPRPHGAGPDEHRGAAETPRERSDARQGTELSDAEMREVRALQQRDREVRAHEMAHIAAGAGLITAGASFTYVVGPDGQRYAVGGEVGIDTSPGRTPEETLVKAQQIIAAALAPADPSPQDHRVAAMAAQMAAQARIELATQAREEEQERQDAADDEASAFVFTAGRAIEAYSGMLAMSEISTTGRVSDYA